MDNLIVFDSHPQLSAILKYLHFEPDSDQAEIAEELFEEAKSIAAPKTLTKTVPVTINSETVTLGGVEITYPYVRKMLSGNDKVVAYISTCGTELEDWSLTKKGDPLEEFIADAIKLNYLYAAHKPFREAVKNEIFEKTGHLAALNPGSLDLWPISEQKNLFAILGGEEEVKEKIGVTLAESFLMSPTKSTSGVLFISEVEYENCELCPRLTCPNRRAKFKGA
ncbi:MAG: vitamin B12 dependent methionine synthase [Clostridia bacterium]|nr:vitamin B12 dependent methionine synthase [Clostridia bacterium]